MSKFLEIEFKNLLTENEFQKFIDFFMFKTDDFRSQRNIYFDTNDFLLKNKHCAIRIREKAGVYELTLKEPSENGLLETNQHITEDEAKSIIETGIICKGEVSTRLGELSLPAILSTIAELTTNRYETPYNIGVLMLDESSYYGKTDYEVEFEVNDYDGGKKVFYELLSNFEIDIKPTKNKIARAIEQKQLINKL